MVGEIRDQETAEIGVKAALTGHLVLSTIHTNDTPSSINRMLNMQTVEILAQQTVNNTFAGIVGKVKHDLKSGLAFAESLTKHQEVFDARYTNMVSAGETGGILHTTLTRLAVYMEKAVKLKAKTKSAMI